MFSMLLILASIGAIVYGVVRLLEQVRKPVDATVLQSQDRYRQVDAVMASDPQERRVVVDRQSHRYDCISAQYAHDGKTYRVPECRKRCPKKGDADAIAIPVGETGSVARCLLHNRGRWNDCRTKVKYEFDGQTFEQEIDLPHNSECSTEFASGQSVRLMHSTKENKAIAEEEYQNPETIGWISIGAGVVLLLLSLPGAIRASTKEGCASISREREAAAANPGNALVDGLFLGSLLSDMQPRMSMDVSNPA